jgi:propionyl-CoA carboxylase alpha chain
VLAARTVDYRNAGTVEFLLDQDSGEFFFLEMNTRLQVEHPVTECTTGLDLVALQLEVAAGGRLPEQPPAFRGHSIEVRLYAEDPAADWQPQSGTVHRLHVPGVVTEFRTGVQEAGLRLDSGVIDGSAVGIHYDPMLAKVISWAPTREQAAGALAGALERTQVHGLVTNRDLLVNVLRHPRFLSGDFDTGFLEADALELLAAERGGVEADRLCSLAAALAVDAADRASAPLLRGVPSGWRNVASQDQSIELLGRDVSNEVRYRITRHGLEAPDYPAVTLVDRTPDEVVLDDGGVRRRFDVRRYSMDVYVDAPMGSRHYRIVDRFADPAHQLAAGSLLAPMPGAVVRTAVEVGTVVAAGQPIIWLEAMKMQHQIEAPCDGVVTELPVSPGQQVDVGAVLAVVTSKEEDGS